MIRRDGGVVRFAVYVPVRGGVASQPWPVLFSHCRGERRCAISSHAIAVPVDVAVVPQAVPAPRSVVVPAGGIKRSAGTGS
jgi:hypothetical protein